MKRIKKLLLKPVTQAIGWVKLRFGIEPFFDALLHRRVAKTPWYYGGGAALAFFLGVLIVTGCFLALDYSPSPGTAYESIRRITHENRLGWLLRAIHYWAAGSMVVLLLFHVFRQLLFGGYLAPREGLWLIGTGLFFLTWINAFTGYTLRWDERAIYGIRVALNIFYHVPFIGDELVRLVQGGWTLGEATLSRLYAVHVLFVPLGLLGLAGYHLYLVILHGVTTEAERKMEPTVSTAEEQKALYDHLKKSPVSGTEFHPETTLKSGSFALAAFAVAVTLAAWLGPQELLPEANLTREGFPLEQIPKEEWWLHWYSAVAAYLPPWLAPVFYVGFPIALFGAMVLLPFIDRGENRGAWRRPLAVTTVILVICGGFALTSLRLQSAWTAWPRSELPPLPPGVTISPAATQGRALFVRYGCNTCHAIGGHGAKFGPNLTALHARLSKSELIQYISEPPSDVAMPAYQNRASAEEIDRLAEWVLAAQTFPRDYPQQKTEAKADADSSDR